MARTKSKAGSKYKESWKPRDKAPQVGADGQVTEHALTQAEILSAVWVVGRHSGKRILRIHGYDRAKDQFSCGALDVLTGTLCDVTVNGGPVADVVRLARLLIGKRKIELTSYA